MKQDKKGAVTRRTFLAAAGTAAAALSTRASAQGAPIKIGLSIAQTGGLGAGGKAALLGLQMWRDDVNAKGGIIGRKVGALVGQRVTHGHPPLVPVRGVEVPGFLVRFDLQKA